MKQFYILAFLFLIMGGVFYIYAQDLIILKNGNVIEAQVLEISPLEVRYKRFNHLDGPVIIILKNDVLSIRYRNGMVEIFNNAPTDSLQDSVQSQSFQANENSSVPRPGVPAVLQPVLNSLPAISIAGNSLKFEFSGENWLAKVNGRNFLEGTITSVNTEEGSILTLKQTHTYVAGRRVNTPGSDIILEYKKGPPASLRQVSRPQDNSSTQSSNSQRTNSQSSITRQSNTQTTSVANNDAVLNPAPVETTRANIDTRTLNNEKGYTVSRLSGNVQYQKNMGDTWNNIIVGDIFTNDIRIRTSLNSVIVLFDGNETITIPGGREGRIDSLLRMR